MDHQDTAGLSARRLAMGLLHGILVERRPFDELWDGAPLIAALDPRDRGFVMALTLTALRHKGEAEAVLASFLDKPLPRKAGAAPLILLAGATQLLFMALPPHAVIDLSVRLAKEDQGARHFSGLINAVLRKVAAGGVALLDGLEAPRLNTPDWLWTRWVKTYGEDRTRAIAQAHMQEPDLDVNVKNDLEHWAAELGGTLLPTGAIRLKGVASVEKLPGFAEGQWWVQDAAAGLPVKLLGDVRKKRVLDLCAAPGGKTLQLCAMGASVTALDVSAARLERLRENLRRTGFAAEVVTADVFDYRPQEMFDAVLLDAPCSATGTIRRHPDLPYLKTAEQIGALVELQWKMLAHAATLVKPGGRLVYCTCSLEPQEGEKQVTAFLKKHSDFSLVPAVMPDPAMVTADGFLRTLPSMGMDGFFAAGLTKTF
ncbi:16S rRNA (cytosine(967)-C(5))-methyltransferase RsmB [Aestuariivirga sp.]|uniref:16S rRNA (cytosine(967)-C(5))-methyltransferase RsmB n=1 Tax=Aestuariivirga sp. TaxID=2650926 RepID=UPI0039E361F5